MNSTWNQLLHSLHRHSIKEKTQMLEKAMISRKSYLRAAQNQMCWQEDN